MASIVPVATVASNLGLDYSSMSAADQASFTYLCNSASALIVGETSISFSQVTETIRIGADGRGEFLLLKNPIASVNSATDCGSGDALTVNPIPYVAGYYDIIWDGLDRLWGLFPWQIVDLSLTHGWSTVPDDIQFVLTEVVRRTKDNPLNTTKRRVGDVEVDYATPRVGDAVAAFTTTEQSVLDNYKTTEASWQLEVRPDKQDPHDYTRIYWGWW